MNKSNLAIIVMLIGVVSCSYLESGDPYVGSSGKKVETGTRATGKVTTTKSTEAKSTSSTTSSDTIDNKFDATDQKIVAFIDEKVHEDAAQIRQVTIDGLNKLLKEKNIRMTKREFLARTYQIIRDNNMNSYYLAAGRLLNQLK